MDSFYELAKNRRSIRKYLDKPERENRFYFTHRLNVTGIQTCQWLGIHRCR